MDEDRIALDFITVYKNIKDKSFRRREKRMEEGKTLLEKKKDGRSRLDKIRK